MPAAKTAAAQGKVRRARMLKFIKAFMKKHGYSPSIMEIGAAVGLSSPNSIRSQLLKMQEEGTIEITPRVARSIRVVE